MMFEKDKFEVLGMLIHILKDSQNSQNLEIACHDIGQFIRYHPMGRQFVAFSCCFLFLTLCYQDY